MKTYYEIKTALNSVLDVDDTSRRVKNVLNRANYKDFDEDVITPTASVKTIKERGPQGKNLIWHLTDHRAEIKSAVGKFSELYMEGDELIGVTNIPNTTLGNDVLELYKTGHINQHSIGFKTINSEKKNDSVYGQYNLITEYMMFEGSLVLWGANDATPNRSTGKSLNKEEREAEAMKTWERLQTVRYAIKSAKVTDETFELLYIEEKQLEEKLTSLLSVQEPTQPEIPTEPEVSKTVDYSLLFTNYLKQKQAI
jgi:HK97 family phage prohead protease